MIRVRILQMNPKLGWIFALFPPSGKRPDGTNHAVTGVATNGGQHYSRCRARIILRSRYLPSSGLLELKMGGQTVHFALDTSAATACQEMLWTVLAAS